MKRIVGGLLLLLLPAVTLFAVADRIPGDLDFDGDVDFADFVILAQNFGKTEGLCLVQREHHRYWRTLRTRGWNETP